MGPIFTGDQDVNKIDSKTGKSAHASKDISQGKVVNRVSYQSFVISTCQRRPVVAGIGAGIRHHARDRIQEALAKNPVSATQKDAQGVAQRLEEACFQRAETGGNPR